MDSSVIDPGEWEGYCIENMKRHASECSQHVVSQKRICPAFAGHGLKELLLSKSIIPASEFSKITSDVSLENNAKEWMLENLDWICDKTVKFYGSNKTRNVIGIEVSEASRYFNRQLHYHQNKSSHLIIPEFLEESFTDVISYVRGQKVVFTEENCISLYQSADFLLMDYLRSQCLQFIQKCCRESTSFALKLWSAFRDVYAPDLTSLAFEEIICCFSVAVDRSEWLDLTCDEITEILRCDYLDSVSELTLFGAIVRWVEKDAKKRIQNLDSLLCCIRFGRLTNAELPLLLEHPMVQACPGYLHLLREYPNITENGASFFSQHIESLSVVATPRQPHEVVFVFGGWCESEGPKAACQVYDPRADQWSLWTPGQDETLPSNHIGQIEKRVYAGCVMVDKTIYLVGGFDGRSALKSVLCYDLRQKSGWYESSCMLERRYYVCSVELDGFLYAIGGHTGEAQQNGRLSTVERLSLEENTWYVIQSMHYVRSDAGAAALNGKIYVAGGFDGRNYHDSVESYDPLQDQWTTVTRMNKPRGGICLITFGNMLYAIGGNDGTNRIDVIEKFSETSFEWVYAGRLTKRKSNLSASVVGKNILIIGGWSDEDEPGILSSVESYNPLSQTSVLVQSMHFSASATSACTLSDRHIVADYVNRHFSILPWQQLRSPEQMLVRTDPSFSEQLVQDDPSIPSTSVESQPS